MRTLRTRSEANVPSAAAQPRAEAELLAPPHAPEELRFTRLSRAAWATLYPRVFDIDPLACWSGERMHFVEMNEDVGRARSQLRRRNLVAKLPRYLERSHPVGLIEARAAHWSLRFARAWIRPCRLRDLRRRAALAILVEAPRDLPIVQHPANVDTAAHLVDQTIARDFDTASVVLTVPFEFRLLLAAQSEALNHWLSQLIIPCSVVRQALKRT